MCDVSVGSGDGDKCDVSTEDGEGRGGRGH